MEDDTGPTDKIEHIGIIAQRVLGKAAARRAELDARRMKTKEAARERRQRYAPWTRATPARRAGQETH